MLKTPYLCGQIVTNQVSKQQAMRRRKRIAWLLLLVYVPMMTAVTLHHHGEAQTDGDLVECQDCARHVRHSGHLLSLQHALHDCVLCQLQSTLYIAPALQVLAASLVLRPIMHRVACVHCQQRTSDVRSTRAPPCVA